jgi:hypothetical protein
MPGTFDIVCVSCKRTFRATLAILASKKTCLFCGAALRIPDEVTALLRERAAAAAPAAQGKVGVECPLCLRRTFVLRGALGRRNLCSYCTCLFVPSQDGVVVVDAPVMPVPLTLCGALTDIACTACSRKNLALSENAMAEARCRSCGAEAVLYEHPLEKFVQLPSAASPSAMSALARQALLARWERREVGLGEAVRIVEDFKNVDWVLESRGEAITSASPEVAAEVVQYAILGASSALRVNDAEGLTLTIPVGPGRKGGMGDALGRALALNLVGLGLLAATGTGFIGYSKGKEEEVTVDPALILRLAQSPEGTVLEAHQRNPDGSVTPVDRATRERLQSQLRAAMPDGLRRYYAFKALFGYWVNGQMLYGTPAAAVRRRLEQIGGPFASQAGALAEALVPRPQ